jgi:hypothetical protein
VTTARILLIGWWLAVALFAAAGAPGPALAQQKAPLLLDGKKTLYQRVLTRPGAVLVPQPGETAGTAVPALSQYYVYERRPLAGKEWLAVGAASRGQIDGWLGADASLPWRQQMALAFTNPAGRDRTLLFAERQTVLDLLKAPDPGVAVAPIRKTVEAGGSDARVVSIEPATYIDIGKRFYLLPILEAQEVEAAKGFRVRTLEIASVTAKKDERSPADASAAAQAPPQPAALRTFSSAIVFVIDSTISMGPYIDRTREAVRRVYAAIEQAGLARQARFGLIGFRSSTKAVPKLEYDAKVFADPSEVKDGADFLARIADLKPASVSSAKFSEDSYGGVMTAIRKIRWDEFGGRYLILITDAGAIAGSDPLSSTGLDGREVRLEAERLGIALYTLHLKTPEGKRDHGPAERQYREVSFNPVVNRPLYYPVEGGSVAQFGTIVDTLAHALVAQVQGAAKGEIVPGSARSAKLEAPKADPEKVRSQLAEDTQLLGRAMQLAYLGRMQGTTAPALFRAWLADRDFAQLDRPTTEVRVLLTKNQLNDMAQVVTTILDAGEKSQATSTTAFFDLIRSAAAHLARDPAALNNPNATRLGELGLLGEYLDDLPYKSDVMGLSRDIWASWGTSEQEELLDRLRRKLRLYQVYHDDVDRWVTLAPGADAGDAVYPVPLGALP